MKPVDDIEKLVKKINAVPRAGMDKRILNDIFEAQEKTKKETSADFQPSVWRMIMKSKMAKLAAAAVIIIAAILGLNTIFNKSVSPAYALEQTIQACHSVRYIHVKVFEPSHEEPKEFWAEFDEYGSVKNLRAELPEWSDPYGKDGTKSIVWKDNKAQIWLPKKNIFGTIKNKSFAAQMLLFFQNLDPKLAVERLKEKGLNNKAKFEISESSNISEPIVVTVTSLQNEALNEALVKECAAIEKEERSAVLTATPDVNALCHRIVLYIDPATKLITSIELYRLKDGDYQKTGDIEYFDYNQPINAQIFTIEHIPADATIIDQTAQEVGLIKGQLSEKEIAVEVVRQFFEALIAEDYARAGQLYEGLPANKLKEELCKGKRKYLRIISIGEPTPSTLTGGYKVPCVIEIEKDGEVKPWSPYGPFVRQVLGQPERWTICGGI